MPLWAAKGAKFDFAYRDKLALWGRLEEQVRLLKENTGIDYTDYKIEEKSEPETYTGETINGFIEAFPKLSSVLQKLFLEFFEKKYAETAQEKFKKLYFQGTIPNRIYELSQEVQNLKNENSSLQTTLNTLQNENGSLRGTTDTLRNEITALKENIISLQNKTVDAENACNNILNSHSWRFTKPLRMVSSCLKKITGK
jgi:chromosome segregation ATPase